MSKKQVIAQLNQYRDIYPDEAETVEQFIRFIAQHEDCFHRSLKVGHLTGSAWVVNQPGTHVLLTHHRKLNKWLQLGGHADGSPDLWQVALREVREESGLVQVEPVFPAIFDIDIHLIPARHDEPAHHHYDIRFAIQVTGSVQYTVSHESHDLAWIDIETLSDLTSAPSMLRMAQKWARMAQKWAKVVHK